MSSYKIAFKLFVVLTLLTGAFYPLLVTFVAQGFMSWKARGSILEKNGQMIGSVLIGQNFKNENYFWPRPSAVDYDPLTPSGGSNLGPLSHKLKELMAERIKQYGADAPMEMLFASGSGLDPHISLEAAHYQVERIAKIRKLAPDEIQAIIYKNAEGRFFGFLGPLYVNVLILNMSLDEHGRD